MCTIRPCPQICQNPAYSGTIDLLKKMSESFNIEITWVKSGCPVDDYKKNLKPNTRVNNYREMPLLRQPYTFKCS